MSPSSTLALSMDASSLNTRPRQSKRCVDAGTPETRSTSSFTLGVLARESSRVASSRVVSLSSVETRAAMGETRARAAMGETRARARRRGRGRGRARGVARRTRFIVLK